MAHEVFISYCERDRQLAETTCAKLESCSIPCFLASRDMRSGADAALAENWAIKNSRIMVVIFTDTANNSPKIARQLQTAMDSGLTIFPLKMTSMPLSDTMQFYLSTVHWLDGVGQNLSACLNLLTVECQKIRYGENTKPKKAFSDTKSTMNTIKRGGKKILSAIYVLMFLIGIFYVLILLSDIGNNSVDTLPISLVTAALIFPLAHSLAQLNEKYRSFSEKLWHPVLVVDTLLLIAALFGFTVPRVLHPMEVTYVSDEQTANSLNGGYAASYGELVYYFGNDDGEGLYVISRRGFEEGETGTKLLDGRIENICAADGIVFFNKYTGSQKYLYRFDPGNGELKKLSEYVTGMTIPQEGFILFMSDVSDPTLRYITTDGKRASDYNRCFGSSSYVIFNGMVYFLEKNGYVCYHEGKVDPASVTTSPVFAGDYLTVLNGHFYLSGTGSLGGIARIDIDGKTATLVSKVGSSQMVISDGWVYYIGANDGKIHSFEELTGIEGICTDGIIRGEQKTFTNINIIGDTLYIRSSDGEFYRVSVSSLQNGADTAA